MVVVVVTVRVFVLVIAVHVIVDAVVVISDFGRFLLSLLLLLSA